MHAIRVNKPRCFLMCVLAPDGMPAAQANREFNTFIADQNLPLVLFHDHFIGQPGGVAIFHAETAREREALVGAAGLLGWRVELHPLIFSHSPAAFGEQVTFTLRTYRGQDWERLRRERRPRYGDPMREAETASEDV